MIKLFDGANGGAERPATQMPIRRVDTLDLLQHPVPADDLARVQQRVGHRVPGREGRGAEATEGTERVSARARAPPPRPRHLGTYRARLKSFFSVLDHVG